MLQSLWSDDLLLEQLQSRGEIDVTGTCFKNKDD